MIEPWFLMMVPEEFLLRTTAEGIINITDNEDGIAKLELFCKMMMWK